MKIVKGSDHAIIFFNYVMDQLLRHNKLIKKSFSASITLEEKIFIINALEDKKCTFEANTNWKECINVVESVTFDSINNRLTISSNPHFNARLKEASIDTWPTKITQSF